MYRHYPGKLSKGSVLDVGLKCAHSCKFCYYSFLDKTDNQFTGMRKAKFRTVEECKEILRGLKKNGFINFDVTGGEPTLHPHIVELMRYAHNDLGLNGRIITLGQFLMKKMPNCKYDKLIDDLLEAGLTNFLFSLHAVNQDIFHQITGENFEKLQNAMSYLDEKDFQYTSNTVVFEWNYKHLPEIAHEVLKHKIYLHNFIIMNAYYEWNHDGRSFGVQAKYSDIYPYIKEAVEILESNHCAVNIRYAPMCGFKGLEKNLVGMVGVRYDPYEWMNIAGHMGGEPNFCSQIIPIDEGQIENHLVYRNVELEHNNGVKVTGVRGDNLKHFSKVCDQCSAKDVCDGIDPNYLKIYGDKEFIPYTNDIGKAPIQNPRFSYIAPFVVKTSQSEDIKSVVQDELIKYKEKKESKKASIVEPKVSVVIPCYNAERYLIETVTSILKQTWQDFEIIIVNDGSTDNSKVIAEKLIKNHPNYQIVLINKPTSSQPAVARNIGISEAKGEYILPLDADDLIAPTMLEECLQLLENHSEIAIAYTDRQDFDGASQIVLAGDYDFLKLRHTNHISYCALFKKELWEKVGGYRVNVRGCEDWDFWIAAGAMGYFGYRIPKPLFKYRVKDTGVYQEVLKYFDYKFAQIIVNNHQLYEENDIIAARKFLSENSRNKLVEKTIAPTVNQSETITGEEHKYKTVILSEIPDLDYKNVLHIGCGNGFITEKLPGSNILGVDISNNKEVNQKNFFKNHKTQLIQASIFELPNKLTDSYDLIVINDLMYSHYIGDACNLIYTIINKLMLDDGILVCCHIDDSYQSRFPYLMLEYSFFEYKNYTQRLEVYVK